MRRTIEEMREIAADWEEYAQDPDATEEAREQYAELARRERAEILRLESISV